MTEAGNNRKRDLNASYAGTDEIWVPSDSYSGTSPRGPDWQPLFYPTEFPQQPQKEKPKNRDRWLQKQINRRGFKKK